MIAGTGPAPSIVLRLIQRLPSDSLTHALYAGDRSGFGWNQTTYLLADIFDAMNLNTKATGNWKKGKAPDFPPYVRPTQRRKPRSRSANPDQKPQSKSLVAALHSKFFGGK